MATRRIVLRTIFKFKRGKAETWTRLNPVLEDGEPGFELDTGKLKIGNGTTDWNHLKYFGGDVSIAADGKSITISDTGEMGLYGFEDAKEGQIPMKGNEEHLEWIDQDEPIPESDIERILN